MNLNRNKLKLTKNSAGKGDRYRPVDQEKYRKNYDLIFKKKKNHDTKRT